METIKLNIPNMKCMGCVGTIENHLNKVNGISKVITDLPTRTATIEYNGDKSIKSLIIRTLEGLGYPAEIV